MSSPDWQKIAKELGTSDKERVAIWMIQHGLATGHGETLDDLLHELSWQIKEKDAVIETMNEAHKLLMAEKDAEIERLKEENAHFAWRDKDKDKLITELADALWGATCDMHGGAPETTSELIQRAREATR
jgi:hypothetical protein